MKFVDEANILVQAGNGGDGIVSFRREKFVPNGGPDGGDGGDGGSVYLVASTGINTLVDFRTKRVFNAPHGQAGSGNNRRGRSGEDLLITVPVGTYAYMKDTKEHIGELLEDASQLLVCQGGWHGIGNARFKSSTNQTPRKATKGKLGEERALFLELKLLADVGIIGMPNAGKSSFIQSITNSPSKIANYPFTTRYPQLGVWRSHTHQEFVIADLPGMLAGAAEGVGLGIQFLKHASRCRSLIQMVDITSATVLADIETILHELKQYDINTNNESQLFSKPRIIVLNKCDLLPNQASSQKIAESVSRAYPDCFITTSVAITGENCESILYQATKS